MGLEFPNTIFLNVVFFLYKNVLFALLVGVFLCLLFSVEITGYEPGDLY